MSQLELHGRAWTVFDPADQQHRAQWGRCPVRFVVPDDHGNLISMIQRNLVSYYVTQEFQRKRKKQC